MKLKKLNAVLSLASMAALLLHLGYSVYAYLKYYYNPTLTKTFSIILMVLTSLHAVLGMSIVFLSGDGSRLSDYPKQNIRTILQRMSAALFFPLLILHVKTFELLKTFSGKDAWFMFYLLIFTEIIFYGTIILHVAVSLTRALITMGWLQSRKVMRILDLCIWAICSLAFLVSAVAVVRTQLIMFAG